MRTVLIADRVPLKSSDKLKLCKYLKKTNPDARVSFLLLGSIVPRHMTWSADLSFWRKIRRRIHLSAKRFMYTLLPGVSIVEQNRFREVFKDGGTCTVVIPHWEHRDQVEDIIDPYLHDHTGQCDLFLLNERYDLIPLDFSKPALPQLDYHVCWHCNLKCKGCGHLCNLYKSPPPMGNLEGYVSDLKRLSELFRTVRTFHLMGGEPLLNPELPNFITETRSIFPDSRIEVVSNGLLIPKASDTLFKAMRENGAVFSITCYPPTERIKERIIEVCDKERIPYKFTTEVRYFYRQKHRWRYFNVGKSYEQCTYSYCHTLQDGKLCVCTAPIAEEKAKDLSPSICRVSSYDTIDIYSPEISSGYDILDRFSCPIPYCRFCDMKGERFAWQGHYPEPIDWR